MLIWVAFPVPSVKVTVLACTELAFKVHNVVIICQ